MNTHFEFKSSAFPKYEDEDDEVVNPTRWGKRLAEFIRDNLPKYGVETEEIFCEDWGWLVYITNTEFSLWIGCGPTDDLDEDGNLNAQETYGMTDFAVFIAAEPSFFKKLFKKVDTSVAISKVSSAMERMLQERDEFTDVSFGN